MEEKLKSINQYFELINLKAFCKMYGENYDFTRQVLEGKRTLTEKFVEKIILLIKAFQEKQLEIFRKL